MGSLFYYSFSYAGKRSNQCDTRLDPAMIMKIADFERQPWLLLELVGTVVFQGSSDGTASVCNVTIAWRMLPGKRDGRLKVVTACS